MILNKYRAKAIECYNVCMNTNLNDVMKYTLFLRILFFPVQAEYSYFSANFRLKYSWKHSKTEVYIRHIRFIVDFDDVEVFEFF